MRTRLLRLLWGSHTYQVCRYIYSSNPGTGSQLLGSVAELCLCFKDGPNGKTVQRG